MKLESRKAKTLYGKILEIYDSVSLKINPSFV